MIPSSPYSPFGATNPGGGVDDFLAKYQLMNQPQQDQPKPVPTAITELDDFLAGLPSDKRSAVENSPEYQNHKLRLFEKFLTYQIAMTPDGNSFLGTSAGKKLSQNLLDSAQRIANNFESESRNELQAMKDLIAKQSNQIEKLQSELNEQKLIFDFQKSEKQQPKEQVVSSPKPPAVIISHKGETN